MIAVFAILMTATIGMVYVNSPRSTHERHFGAMLEPTALSDVVVRVGRFPTGFL